MSKMDIRLLKYLGRPYEKYNCLDLVKEFYSDYYGLTIKNYFEGEVVPDRRTVESLIISGKGDFEEVKGKPEFGDIVVIKLYGVECHIGVCISSSQFLHSARHIGSHIDRLERYSKMIAGYFRHRVIA